MGILYPEQPLWPPDFRDPCRIVGIMLDHAGNAITGVVRLTPQPGWLINPAQPSTIFRRTLNLPCENGIVDTLVPPTDDPDVTPTGTTYQVVEDWPGGRTYNIEAPTNAIVDLSTAAPINTPPDWGDPIAVGPPGPQGEPGPPGDPTVYELRGSGMPEGVVTASPGTYWTDTAATNGAIRWVKATGTGATGWRVLYGDTGWRTFTSWDTTGTVTGVPLQPAVVPRPSTAGNIQVRRIADVTLVRTTQLSAGSTALTAGTYATVWLAADVPSGWFLGDAQVTFSTAVAGVSGLRWWNSAAAGAGLAVAVSAATAAGVIIAGAIGSIGTFPLNPALAWPASLP